MRRLFLVLSLLFTTTIHAQDSSTVKIEQLDLGYKKIDQVYVWTTVVGLSAAIKYPKYNTDFGGYKDIWMSGDKGAHFLVHYVISDLFQEAGMDGWKAAFGGCLVGMGYEWVQRYNGEIHYGKGFSSTKDMQANCAGSFAAWGKQAIVRRYKKKYHIRQRD